MVLLYFKNEKFTIYFKTLQGWYWVLLMQKIHLKTLDVNTIFLHRDLEKDVYMKN